MGQWYSDQRVASAGVSGVGIDLGYRGSEACKRLLQLTLRELFDESLTIAALFASTRGLYRSVGFEISGHLIEYSWKMTSFKSIQMQWSIKPLERSLPTLKSKQSFPNYAFESTMGISIVPIACGSAFWYRLVGIPLPIFRLVN